MFLRCFSTFRKFSLTYWEQKREKQNLPFVHFLIVMHSVQNEWVKRTSCTESLGWWQINLKCSFPIQNQTYMFNYMKHVRNVLNYVYPWLNTNDIMWCTLRYLDFTFTRQSIHSCPSKAEILRHLEIRTKKIIEGILNAGIYFESPCNVYMQPFFLLFCFLAAGIFLTFIKRALTYYHVKMSGYDLFLHCLHYIWYKNIYIFF